MEYNAHSLKGFRPLQVLGKGSFGIVTKVQRKIDGQIYAMKEIDIKSMSQSEREEAVNEIRILASINHPSVIRYCESFIDGNKLYIITEYAENGELYQYIQRQRRKNKYIKEDIIWKFFIQLCMGLHSLHKRNILHRDIKSPNVFLSNNNQIKIGDLGVAKLLKRAKFAVTQVGTPYYTSPEVWQNKPYDAKSDIWSLGCLLYELCTLRRPFEANDLNTLVKRICRGQYPPISSAYSPDLSNLIKKMLELNPLRRPYVEDLLAMDCINKRMYLVLDIYGNLVPTTKYQTVLSNGRPKQFIYASPCKSRLRDTIKVPRNLSKITFPSPAYKTLNGRIHEEEKENHSDFKLPMIKVPRNRIKGPISCRTPRRRLPFNNVPYIHNRLW